MESARLRPIAAQYFRAKTLDERALVAADMVHVHVREAEPGELGELLTVGGGIRRNKDVILEVFDSHRAREMREILWATNVGAAKAHAAVGPLAKRGRFGLGERVGKTHVPLNHTGHGCRILAGLAGTGSKALEQRRKLLGR